MTRRDFGTRTPTWYWPITATCVALWALAPLSIDRLPGVVSFALAPIILVATITLIVTHRRFTSGLRQRSGSFHATAAFAAVSFVISVDYAISAVWSSRLPAILGAACCWGIIFIAGRRIDRMESARFASHGTPLGTRAMG